MASGEENPKIKAAAVTRGEMRRQRARKYPREIEGFISQKKVGDDWCQRRRLDSVKGEINLAGA
jgi:proteasome lid subunit RPN8/RPN11